MYLTHSKAQPLPCVPSLFIPSPLAHRLGGSEQHPASRAQLSPSGGLRDATSNIYRLPLVATATKRDESDSDQLQLKHKTDSSKSWAANALKLNVRRDDAAKAALKDALMIVKDDMVEKYLAKWPEFDQKPKMLVLDPESPLMDIVPELDGEIHFVSSFDDEPLVMLVDGSVDVSRKAITAQLQQAMETRYDRPLTAQPIMLSQYNADQLMAPTQFDTVHDEGHGTGENIRPEHGSILKNIQSSAIHGHLLANRATVDFEGWNHDKGVESVTTSNGVQTMYMSATSRHHQKFSAKQECVFVAVLCAMAPIVLPSLAVIYACDKLGLLENMKKDLDES